MQRNRTTPVLRDVTIVYADPRKPVTPYRLQRHRFHEIVYVVRGRYAVRARGLSWNGSPGWLYCYPPQLPHRTSVRPTPAAREAIVLIVQWSEPHPPRAYPAAHFDASRRFRHILEWLLDLHTSRRTADRAAAPLLLDLLLHELARAADHRQSLLPAAEVYIADHLPRPVRVTTMAAALGLSRSHFSRAFRDLAGVSPSRHVARARLRRALDALSSGSARTLSEAARLAGFNSASHLSRTCRRELRQTALQASGTKARLRSSK